MYNYRHTVLTAVESRLDSWDQFTTVIFTLNMHRKPLYYIVNLIVPCFLLSLIAVVTFILVQSYVDRLQIGSYVYSIINKQ